MAYSAAGHCGEKHGYIRALLPLMAAHLRGAIADAGK